MLAVLTHTRLPEDMEGSQNRGISLGSWEPNRNHLPSCSSPPLGSAPAQTLSKGPTEGWPLATWLSEAATWLET